MTPAWKAVQPPHDPQAWDVVDENNVPIASLKWNYHGKQHAHLMAAAPALQAACLLAQEKLRHYSGEYNGGPHIKQVNDVLAAALALAKVPA